MKRIRSILCNRITTVICLITYISCPAIVEAQSKDAATLDQPGYYRTKLGACQVTAISDGTVPIDLHQLLTNTTTKTTDELSSHSYQTAIEEASVNAYLLNIEGKYILIDAGTAELYGPTLGHLPDNLRKAGVTPEQIDAILITHIHTDHTGGLMEGDKMVFPNATIYISQPEVDFWLTAESKAKAPARLAHWFKEAEDKVGPYLRAGKVRIFRYGKPLFQGITPVAAPGHTPGHTFYSLESEGQQMLFIGDLVHAAAVQFPAPSVTITFDVDPNAAAAQRINTFRDAASKGYWLAADHISFPGIGHVRKSGEKQGEGFTWVPINYSTLGSGQ